MTKRKKKSGNANGNVNNSNKRPRNDKGSGLMAGNPDGYYDKSTGQHGAFPGIFPNDAPYLGPAHDGLSYLRMVRSEASLVPSLLLSASIPRPPRPKPSFDTRDYDRPITSATADAELCYDEPPATLNYDEPASVEDLYNEEEKEGETYEDTPEDEDYYFTESTYISLHRAPTPPPPPPHHDALLDRFRALRLSLRTSPPQPLDPAPKFPRTFSYSWVIEMSPSPSILWSMDQQRVIRMIGALGHQIGTGTRTVRRGLEKRLGQWAWGLLLRVDEAMTGDEVGTVRQMAKIALGVLKKVLEMEEKGELEKHVKEGEGKDEGETENTFEDGEEEAAEDTQPVKEDGIQGEARSGDADEEILENREVNTADPTPITADTQASSHPEVDWNYTIATLDMIVSIIGDFFGQRDLLEERSLLGNK